MTAEAEAWKRGWHSFAAPYNRRTADRRTFEPNSLTHRQLPIPLMFQIATDRGHIGAVTVGSATGWDEGDDGIYPHGRWLDPDVVPEVRRAMALADAGVANPSVDLEPGTIIATLRDDPAGDGQLTVYHQAVVAGITIVPVAAFDGTFVRLNAETQAESTFALTGTRSWKSLPIAKREVEFNSDQAIVNILNWSNGSDDHARQMFLWTDPQQSVGTRDRYRLPIGDIIDGRPALVYHAIYSAAALLSGAHGGLPGIPDDEKARLRSVVSEIYTRMAGAFGDARMIAPWDARAKMPDDKAGLRTVTAGIGPLAPPSAWFDNPKLAGPTSITVTAEGRLLGHLAPWDTCHTGLGQLSGRCVTAPRSKMNYAMFHTGTVETADGQLVRVGRVTTDTTHPIGVGGARLDAVSAAAHYDNTGTCAAVARCGEDEFGIWIAGALVPEASELTAAMLRRHPLSGDWRDVNGNLELVAALAVNSPGFPVVGMRDAHRYTLVASIGVCDTMNDMTTATSGGDGTDGGGSASDGVDESGDSQIAGATGTIPVKSSGENVAAQVADVDPNSSAGDARVDGAASVVAPSLTPEQVREIVANIRNEDQQRDEVMQRLAAHAANDWSTRVAGRLAGMPKPEEA